MKVGKSMNKKGQALIEFVLILPVLLIVFMAVADIGNIFIKKNELNDDLSMISEMYQNGKKEQMMAYIANEDLEYKEELNGGFLRLEIEKKVDINAPILSNIIGKKYKIKVSKNIYGESS